MEREPGTQPPLCKSDDDPDAVWGVPMKACITPYSDQQHKAKGTGLAPWPARLTTPPPRLADFGYSAEMFEKDTANLGSFAAALKSKDVWVMNVVPEDGPNTLKIIYDRGLMGSVWNPTRPTHELDLLHGWTVFSDIAKKDCSAVDLLIEMDRILRPTGFIIIRDHPSVVEFVKKHMSALHWEAVATGEAEENEQGGDELVFIVQKKNVANKQKFQCH
ncbi:hypothetical protein NC653_014369 [Populus alba x Populus x berolinensis]|uniref:Methyltransferase n=1 Tax=Populus alba x Populus x berolinensis TaxID=444605 RepID=A0AAD6QWS2_9ROSI|nr:hypothetical protein NC653_014369 [Populus alba x Populus x berolinensis]